MLIPDIDLTDFPKVRHMMNGITGYSECLTYAESYGFG